MSQDIKQKAREILSQLTLDEKVALQTGLNIWQTVPVNRVGLPSVWVSDGPHGLRKTVDKGDNLGVGGSYTAVCLPTASKLACSFDRQLVGQASAILAEQCRQQGVDVLLAPGINIKRNSRGGRNFEYFSEDPYLAGELAVSYVDSVQSQGVGVSVKHFAGNSQEYARMVCDSCIDERALNEIYLRAFKKVVTLTKPYTVMCAYNKLNGELCSQNKHLLTDILREEWGFDGLVVSDWGAVSDRVKSIKSGLDLEMPSQDTSDVKKALKKGQLTVEDLDKCVLRVIELVLRCQGVKSLPQDNESQHERARQIASECTVLLKNQGMLPLAESDDIAVIGEFAMKPHYQGGGSSKVNAYKVVSLVDALRNNGIEFQYAKGYDANSTTVDSTLIEQAVKLAKAHNKVILVVGLPDVCEYEGFDRDTLAMPDSHTELIEAVTQANSNTVVVLQCGAPVEIQCCNNANALIADYLSGEAQGEALYDVLYNKVNPCGRLAESWCVDADSQPCNDMFANNQVRQLYKESVFVGYRYYDTFNQPVAFPFGFGLSYSDFVVRNAELVCNKVAVRDKLTVKLTVDNVGKYDGKTVIQLYASCLSGKYYRPKKQLVGFEKVFVKAGESVQLNIDVDLNELQYYDTDNKKMVLCGGQYELYVAYNVRDVAFTLPFDVIGQGTSRDNSQELPFYYDYSKPLTVSDSDFEKVYGNVPSGNFVRGKKHTADSTLSQICDCMYGRLFYKIIKKNLLSIYQDNPEMLYLAQKSIDASPLRIIKMADGIDGQALKGAVKFINGRPIAGGIAILKALRRAKKKLRKDKK